MDILLRRATVLFFVIAFSIYGAAEIAARVGLGKFSKIHRRILDDRRIAQAVCPAKPGHPKTMLFVGNSLLLEGMNFSQLAIAVLPRFQTFRYTVESTAFYDWMFGIRQLFRHGSRPDYLVLCLSPGQLRSESLRGDFDANFLFDLKDIWPVSRATHASLTTTSGLYFAHFSAFYAARVELRNVLIGKIGLGRVQELWHDLTTSPLVETGEDYIPLYRERLEALGQICKASGVQLLFLIPPTAQPGDGDVVHAGNAGHVPILHPVPNYSLGTEYYRDSFHLNPRGATIFTAAVGKSLLLIP